MTNSTQQAFQTPREAQEIPTRKESSARDRILEAALAEFANRGFDGATTRAIARAAGVTQPLLHYHFETKETLWRAAVDRAFRSQQAAFAGIAAELRDLAPAARTRVLVRRFIAYCAQQPELGRLVVHEGARSSPRLTWLVEEHLRPLFQTLWEDVRAGAREGWAKAVPPQHLIFVVHAAAAYLFNVPAMARQVFDMDVRTPETVEAHAEVLIELLFHGLLRDSEAA